MGEIGKADPSVFGKLEELTDNKLKLDTLLSDAVVFMAEHDRLKAETSIAWSKVAAVQDQLKSEMARQGVKSFEGLTSRARVTIVNKASADFDSQLKYAVFDFLHNNDGSGLINQSVRKDTLGKWINEFVARGGECPNYIFVTQNQIVSIRR